MDPHQFHAPHAGQVVRTPTGYWAFLPAPLPPVICYDADLVSLLSKADAAVSELSGLARLLPNPHLLITPYVLREAVLSSRIEGTRATVTDLLLDDARVRTEAAPADVREVRNYVDALEYGIVRLQELPLSLRLVREMHERLMTGVRGNYATPGDFRRSQNWIGPAGSGPETAPYVPPPPDEMMDALGYWERFLHDRTTIPDLIQCALIHEQFEAIHPFLDGNGRLGRLLITLFLIERGRLSQPLLYLSAYFERQRDEYYVSLQRVRTHGDWPGWLRFFLTGVEETAREAMQQASRLMDLREELRVLLESKPRSGALVDRLFTNPYITVSDAANQLGASNPTARQAIRDLVDLGILEEITGRKWGRVYVAGSILQAIRGE